MRLIGWVRRQKVDRLATIARSSAGAYGELIKRERGEAKWAGLGRAGLGRTGTGPQMQTVGAAKRPGVRVLFLYTHLLSLSIRYDPDSPCRRDVVAATFAVGRTPPALCVPLVGSRRAPPPPPAISKPFRPRAASSSLLSSSTTFSAMSKLVLASPPSTCRLDSPFWCGAFGSGDVNLSGGGGGSSSGGGDGGCSGSGSGSGSGGGGGGGGGHPSNGAGSNRRNGGSCPLTSGSGALFT